MQQLTDTQCHSRVRGNKISIFTVSLLNCLDKVRVASNADTMAQSHNRTHVPRMHCTLNIEQ